jgi:hypothetical protein
MRRDARDPQPVEVKRQRVGGKIERFCDRVGGHAIGAGLHQQAEDVEAVLLRKRGERGDGIYLFFISTDIEMKVVCQSGYPCPEPDKP